MDEATRQAVLALLDTPLAALTVRQVVLLVAVLDVHEDEVMALVPEVAALLAP